MWVAGGLQAPQGTGLLQAAPLGARQQFRSCDACRRQARAQPTRLLPRDRPSESIIACSSNISNGSQPDERDSAALRQLSDNGHRSGQDSISGGFDISNGANGGYNLDEHPATLNGSNGSGPARQTPRLVGAYDSDSEQDSVLTALDQRILAGEYTDAGSTKAKLTKPARKVLSKGFGPGRAAALALAKQARTWERDAAVRMPEATGDVREIVGQPVFVPLFKLFLTYGKIFRLSFGPKSFVVISDAAMAKQLLMTNAKNYSKGLLSEILEFVMGNGMIPADGEIWKTRRRVIMPSLHRAYIAAMISMFGDCTLHATRLLEEAADSGQAIEMENLFSRLTLDIIGKAVFDYDFDSLTHDDPVIQAVYTALREAEYRSTAFVPYWKVPLLRWLVPRQRRCTEAMQIVNTTLDQLISKCKRLVETEDEEWTEDFVGERDPSILHFLLASGDQISSKQLRDDLMTLLIAGHETTAAVLTWTLYCLAQHPHHVATLRAEVDEVLGDRSPTLDDIRALGFTTRCLNESMRLYPQPPVLIRRALEDDIVGGYRVDKDADIFISVWNLHRSPEYWERPNEFDPTRFDLAAGVPNETTHNFSYLPFGGGRRKCIGDQFALFEAVVALAMLMRRYEFTLDPSAPEVGMTTGATIHTSEGLQMHVSRRNTQPAASSNGAGPAAAATAAGTAPQQRQAQAA